MSFTAFGPVYRAACELLPPALDTAAAKAMMITIAMQESRWDERRQINGPAKGFWQFELAGIRGVLGHNASRSIILSVLARLDYDELPQTSYVAVEHNDILAFAYARCLLWTVPEPLPEAGDSEEGWRQYLDAWRPGKPHKQTWGGFYKSAWAMA